jgi:hypothetical protein
MKPTSIRYTDAQHAALTRAVEAYHRRTGRSTNPTQLTREGAAMVCEREGVAWPVES